MSCDNCGKYTGVTFLQKLLESNENSAELVRSMCRAVVPTLVVLVVAGALLWAPVPAAAAAPPTQRQRGVKLCPPGGQSFMMFWNFACEVKRRKRGGTSLVALWSLTLFRHSSPANLKGYRQATMDEFSDICCTHGCEMREFLAYCDPFH